MTVEPPIERLSVPPNPLLLVDPDLWSRLSTMVRQLCVGLVDQAARVHVLHAVDAELGDLLGPVLVAPIPRWSLLRRKPNLLAMVAELPALKPDVIHVLGGGMMWAGQVLHRRLGIPITAHITSPRDIAAIRRTIGLTDLRVLAITEPLRQLARRKLHLSDQACHLVRPGMRSDEKRKTSTGDQGVLTAFVWAHQKSVRSVEAVLTALRKLLKDGRQILLFVIGAGRSEAHLRESATALGLRAQVTFEPAPPGVHLGSAGQDVLILPEPPRILTLQTLGAMAAGVVVVAAGPGLHDCIRDQETALLYSHNDASELARQLDRLLQDRPLARRLSDQGRAYIAEHHKVIDMVRNVVKVYRSAGTNAAPVSKPAAAATS